MYGNLTFSVRSNRKKGEKMGKSLSVYLGDVALDTLENIKKFFGSFGYKPSDSGIITSALSTYGWYLQVKQWQQPRCPNSACGEPLKKIVQKCPACGEPLKWVPITP